MKLQYTKITKEYDRTIVVGDIHGCYTELMKLLDKINFSDNDLLIAVGDLIDRGPASWEVSRFFRDAENAFSIAGNHERGLARVIRGIVDPKWPQLFTLSKISIEEQIPFVEFFEQLPAVIETEHAIITHARLDPDLPIDKQKLYFTSAVGGAGITIEKDSNGVPLWFTKWKEISKNTKPVCMGHLDYNKIDLVERQLYALDSGVAMGRLLTGVVFPEYKIVQIKAEKNYYEESRFEWSRIDLYDVPPEQLLLYKYFTTKEKEWNNKYEEKAIVNFDKYLNNLEIPERVKKLQQKFIKVFGPLPTGAKEKMRYFLSIRKKLPSVNHRLVNMILTPKPFNIDKFLSMYKTGNLLNALVELDDIGGRLKSFK